MVARWMAPTALCPSCAPSTRTCDRQEETTATTWVPGGALRRATDRCRLPSLRRHAHQAWRIGRCEDDAASRAPGTAPRVSSECADFAPLAPRHVEPVHLSVREEGYGLAVGRPEGLDTRPPFLATAAPRTSRAPVTTAPLPVSILRMKHDARAIGRKGGRGEAAAGRPHPALQTSACPAAESETAEPAAPTAPAARPRHHANPARAASASATPIHADRSNTFSRPERPPAATAGSRLGGRPRRPARCGCPRRRECAAADPWSSSAAVPARSPAACREAAPTSRARAFRTFASVSETSSPSNARRPVSIS